MADTLGSEVDSLALETGYVSKELIGTFRIGTEKFLLEECLRARVIRTKRLYWETKDLIGKGKYAFVCKHHAYFGIKTDNSV